MMWDVFQNRLEVTATLVTQTGFRIGKGAQAAEPTASDLPILKTNGDQPYIPGSSLRGVLRSHIERIVRAFEPVADGSYCGRGACSPVNEDEWCVKSGDAEDKRKELRNDAQRDRKYAEWVFGKSCRVCRVFGSSWLASRVRISDLHCINGAKEERRDGVAIDREKETTANKYDFEALPKGTKFKLEVLAENLDELERGLLWIGISELERGNILVGGFKGRGLGRVTLENMQLNFLKHSDLRDYLLNDMMPQLSLKEADAWLDALWKKWEVKVDAQ